ncbi:translation initiation factor eIF-2B [Perkinsela sp. CCAP 1560/4]|nr:translation initiation factor eIF-2B [Perkinsela sp. CCAP 1560/4]|eukprot:KNH07318.1 translation initiation factor eIF-2B [Perkinsela sp. CCAP 1560/4]
MTVSADQPHSPSFTAIIEKFRQDVHDGRFTGTANLSPSLHVAQGAVKTLRDIIGRIRQDVPYSEVISVLRAVGKTLSECEPYRALIANVSRRVLRLVREEHHRCLQAESPVRAPQINQPLEGGVEGSPPSTALSPSQAKEATAELRWGSMKNDILSCVGEYLDELSATKSALCKQADKHVRNDETVLTYGQSKTIESFLAAAAVRRRFRVIVVESCPEKEGEVMANALRAHGVDVTIIPHSSVFAVMGDVGKVILGTQLVLANGGSLAQAGSQVIALCAKHYTVPVLVISATEKFSPYYPVDQICSAVVKCADNSEHSWENRGKAENVLAMSEIPAHAVDRIEVSYVVTDYVKPGLVALYITNEDSFDPSYAYRLISECYSPEDFDV